MLIFLPWRWLNRLYTSWKSQSFKYPLIQRKRHSLEYFFRLSSVTVIFQSFRCWILMSNSVTTPNNQLYKHNTEYRQFFSLLFTILYITLLYVWISVPATLSGQSPGATGVTFSVLFQPVILSVKRAQKVKLPLLFDSKCHCEGKIPATHWVPLVKGNIWELLYVRYEDFTLYLRERINLVIQMMTQAFLHPGKGNAWTQIRPWKRKVWRHPNQSSQLLLSAALSSEMFSLGYAPCCNESILQPWVPGATPRLPDPQAKTLLLCQTEYPVCWLFLFGVGSLSGPWVVTVFGKETAISLLALL